MKDTGEKNVPLEVWGGPECTVNRVRDRFSDQTVRTGHHRRFDDLQRFADLGLRRLRYPVLWEQIAPDAPDERDFGWSDERLAEIHRLGMNVIAGLTHHGSGPHYTNLLEDESFATGLARHARAVAERYPKITAYTPVNEPLTTARFSALYGHWFPHATDEGAMWRAVLNQVDATRLCMREVREVNPAAQLVQTDDLGHTHASPGMAGRAAFDNERRWITWDLLFGRVIPGHRLYQRMADFGLQDRLKRIADDPCPPDVIGVNHYVTSERLLDDDVEAYPPDLRPRPGEPAHVDIEASRVSVEGVIGIEALLAAAWERYKAPLAVTECHNGASRDEQLRWLKEVWAACETLRATGADIRAVTAWSLVGAVDWNSLLTRQDESYESGVFDIRGGAPRETALAPLWRALLKGEPPPPTIADAAPGWWRREIRFTLPCRLDLLAPSPTPRREPAPVTATAAPLLILGASGTLGRAFARRCEAQALPFVIADRATVPLGDEAAARRKLRALRPSAVINCAGWVRVDDAEADADACFLANAAGPIALARACADEGVHFVAFSSDLVFDGRKGRGYVEEDETCPLGVYGASKAAMEHGVMNSGGRNLIIRTAAFYQAHDPHNFGVHVLRTLAQGERVQAAVDSRISPTHVPELVEAVIDLVIDGEVGMRHVAGGGPGVSWADFANLIAEAAGHDPDRIDRINGASLGWRATRPADAALGTNKGWLLPPLERSVRRFVREAARAPRSALNEGVASAGV